MLFDSFFFFPALSKECTAQVGIEITDLNSIFHQFGSPGIDDSLSPYNLNYFCTKMLDSFFNYGESFLKEMYDENGQLDSVIPSRVFERWYINFQERLKSNPNFWKD